MKKIIVLSTSAFFSSLFFLYPTQVHADLIYTPTTVLGLSYKDTFLLVGAGVIVVIAVVISTVMIGAIRKKKRGNHK